MAKETKKCEHCASGKKKERGEEERKKLLNRLNRIEGQVRALKKMLGDDAYCPDIIVQASAASSALNSFCKELLMEHLRSCVVNDIRAGKDDVVEELAATLQKLMR